MNAKDVFRRTLFALADSSLTDADLSQRNEDLRQAFLAFGSETPDNLNCVEYVEHGWVHHREYGDLVHTCGLKLKNTDLLISEIICVLGDEVFTQAVQKQFPNLTVEQCESVNRITTMILLSLECDRQVEAKDEPMPGTLALE